MRYGCVRVRLVRVERLCDRLVLAVRLCESQACACSTVVRDSGLCVRDGCVRVRLVRAGWL